MKNVIYYTNKGEKVIIPAKFENDIRIYTWFINSNGYGCRCKIARPRQEALKTGKPYATKEYLHRFIMSMIIGRELRQGEQVDHKNHNKLDCSIENLRLCSSRSQNSHNQRLAKHNKSGYKGVSQQNRGNKWRAQIKLHNKVYYLGTFDDPLLAALRYDEAALMLHKEFACTNSMLGLL